MARGYDDYDDYDDRDDYDRPPSRPVSYPGAVTAAGVIWIIYGTLQLLGVGLNIINLANAPGRGPGGAGVVPIIIGLAIGVGFLVAGIQSVNGSARDTLGNAIGSFCVAGLAVIGGIFIMVQARRFVGFGPAPGAVLTIFAVILFAIAGILILAAILALAGRDQYRRWKIAQQPHMRRPPRRRRRPRDDYDDDYDD